MTGEIRTGRPRIPVCFALVLHARDVENLGCSRAAQEYRRLTDVHVSRETMKRRYYEIKNVGEKLIKEVVSPEGWGCETNKSGHI